MKIPEAHTLFNMIRISQSTLIKKKTPLSKLRPQKPHTRI